MAGHGRRGPVVPRCGKGRGMRAGCGRPVPGGAVRRARSTPGGAFLVVGCRLPLPAVRPRAATCAPWHCHRPGRRPPRRPACAGRVRAAVRSVPCAETRRNRWEGPRRGNGPAHRGGHRGPRCVRRRGPRGSGRWSPACPAPAPRSGPRGSVAGQRYWSTASSPRLPTRPGRSTTSPATRRRLRRGSRRPLLASPRRPVVGCGGPLWRRWPHCGGPTVGHVSKVTPTVGLWL